MAVHVLLPIRRFAAGHPYAGDWCLVAATAIAALLLWFWNT